MPLCFPARGGQRGETRLSQAGGGGWLPLCFPARGGQRGELADGWEEWPWLGVVRGRRKTCFYQAGVCVVFEGWSRPDHT